MKLLTVEEVSRELNVSATCVYSLVQTGELASIRIGKGRGTIRVDQEDLDDFVEQRRNRPRRMPKKKVNGASFVHLDASRLKSAWQGGE